MALNIWERQADLLTFKLASARADLNRLLDIYDQPVVQHNEEVRERTARLLITVRLKIDEYEKALRDTKSKVRK